MGQDITKLHPILQDKLAELRKLCKAEGLALGIGECYRTVSEQDALYAQGRTKPGAIVTNGKGSSYGSQHQWGIAFDFYKNVAGHAYDDLDFFARVGALAKGIGLAWGGDWVSFKDRPHLYLPDWGSTTTTLKQLYGTPAKFMATWNTITETPVLGVELTVKEFQLAVLADGYSLPKYGADGYWGAETETVAKKAITKRESPAVFLNRTKLIQKAVGVSVDGYFGTATASAVKAWQKKRGLSADGIVGIKTWKAILSVKQ